MEFQNIKSYVIHNKQVNTLPKQKNKSILYSDFLTSEANRYADYQQFFMSAVDALIYTDRLSLKQISFTTYNFTTTTTNVIV